MWGWALAWCWVRGKGCDSCVLPPTYHPAWSRCERLPACPPHRLRSANGGRGTPATAPGAPGPLHGRPLEDACERDCDHGRCGRGSLPEPGIPGTVRSGLRVLCAPIPLFPQGVSIVPKQGRGAVAGSGGGVVELYFIFVVCWRNWASQCRHTHPSRAWSPCL